MIKSSVTSKTNSTVQISARKLQGLSGSVKIIEQHIKYLIQKGYLVQIVADSCEKELAHMAGVKWNKTIKWPQNTFFQRKFYNAQSQRYSRKYNPDLIIGHGDTLNQDILFMHNCVHHAAEAQDPSALHPRNHSRRFHEMILTQGKAQLLICNSELMKSDFQNRFDIKFPIEILRPGFNSQLAHKQDINEIQSIRSSIKATSTHLVIGLIASGSLENRNAFLLIEAVSRLSQEDKQKAIVMIVGKDNRRENIYQYATQHGIGDRVHWKSPQPDVENLIGACDIIVHAAKSEAFGMTVLESMALSRPIITSHTVGCSEIFPEPGQEFVVQSLDAELISQKISLLIKDPELRSQLGALNEVQSRHYTWEKHLERFGQIVEEQSLIKKKANS